MKHYRILSSKSEDALARYVEQALGDGWELSGPLATGTQATGISQRGELWFFQPIIKVTADRPGTE